MTTTFSWAALIRELRAERGLLQRELAEAAGVSRSWVQKMEAGEIVDSKLDTLERVLGVLGYKLAPLSRNPHQVETR
jgi:transcriptional regulator with XRE-family HTH domain